MGLRNLLLKFFDPGSKESFSHRFRLKRFVFFREQLQKAGLLEGAPLRILDIGGTPNFWGKMNFADENVHITLLNLEIYPVSDKMFSSIKGDACNLSQFKDDEFDLVFSNSVIEHLYTWGNQVKMASEAKRVGKSYFVQTPNFYFPIEPHWVFPFFQFLPFSFRVFLTSNFALGHMEKHNKEDAIKRVNEVKLLTVNEMKKLFPGGTVYREKALGLTKSITMFSFNQPK